MGISIFQQGGGPVHQRARKKKRITFAGVNKKSGGRKPGVKVWHRGQEKRRKSVNLQPNTRSSKRNLPLFHNLISETQGRCGGGSRSLPQVKERIWHGGGGGGLQGLRPGSEPNRRRPNSKNSEAGTSKTNQGRTLPSVVLLGGGSRLKAD